MSTLRNVYAVVVAAILVLALAQGVLADEMINPTNTGVATRLPYSPMITDLDGTKFVQHSPSNFTVSYQLPTESDWDGVMVRWDDWGPRDLSSSTEFVFSVRGSAGQIKVEFEATNSSKTICQLLGITNTWQNYRIPASAITNDLTKIKVISFVTDYGMAGPVKTGTYEVVVGGLSFDWRLDGSGSGSPTVLPDHPKVVDVGGGNPSTVILNGDPGLVSVSYDVHSGWSGATIVFDNRDTWPDIEYQDLSSFPNLVFGLWGDARNVKIEFLDRSNGVVVAVCTNVGTTAKYYTLNMGFLTNELSAISAINFVVDSNLVASGNLVGTLNIESAGLDYNLKLNGSGSGVPTVLPLEPVLDKVGGANSDTIVSLNSSSNFVVYYNVTSGWSGASILYDDYGTVPIETANLASFDSLVFGLAGDPSSVKLEIQDSTGRKMTATFTNVGPVVQYYSLSRSHITNKLVNPGAIAGISFVIDEGLAGAGHLNGSLSVLSGGLKYPLQISPALSGSLTTLPATPVAVTPVGGANPDTQVDQYSSGRFRVYYSVASGWSGASILYDDYGSVPIETGDFSGLGTVVFAVQGAPAGMKIEFEDALANKVSAELLGVSGSLQYYSVDIPTISNKGVQVQSVRMINFVVDSNLVGAANLTGKFDVFTAGLSFQNLIYTKVDSDGDSLPDFWEEANGMDPEDDGSGSAVNGALGDVDGDGANNLMEYIAGTDASGDSSSPLLIIDGARSNVTMSIEGVSRRQYRFYQTDHLVTGVWSRVGPVYSCAADGEVSLLEDVQFLAGRYYRCSIKAEEVTRIPGQPQPTIIGGGDSNTVISQLSSSELLVNYNVTQGWAGVTFLYDDYGTPEIETESLAGYSELTFALSGTPQNVKYEFVDSHTNVVVGYFQHVSNTWNTFTIDTGLLAAKGLDLANVRFFNFLVDGPSAGAANLIGSFGIRTWGIGYAIANSGAGVGTVTTLRPTPVVDNLGGGQSTNLWVKTGATNVFVPYNVTPVGSWDGVALSYDDFLTLPFENADYSDVPSLTFGVMGTPQSVKVEFEDTSANKVVATFLSVTSTLKYYTVNVADLEAGGLNPGHMRFINFVIDQAAAGEGNYSGSFTVVTDGLAP